MRRLSLPNLCSLFQRKNVNSCLCSEEEFRTVLKRERARTDRNGQIFSFVVFDSDGAETEVRSFRNFLRVLVRRVRSSDEIGWIDKQHIGVILSDTPPDGARVFADSIQKTLVNSSFSLDYDIFFYPDDKGRKGNKNNIKESNQRTVDDQESDCASSDHDVGFKESKMDDDEFLLFRHEPAAGCRLIPASVVISLWGKPMPGWKRRLDIAGALSGLILLSPLFLLISLIIKIVSPGPVFFKQERVGYGGRLFTLFKFRTMNVNVDTSNHQQYLSELINDASNGKPAGKPMVKLDDDSQIIPFGTILRKSCLDELPQLINVLRGEMSLVGPRPPIPYEAEEYLKWHKGRFDIVPGMTGLWQVSGKNKLTFTEMVRLDIQYSRDLSFLQDMKIIFKTPFAILMQILDRFNKPKLETKGVEQNG